MNNKIYNRKNFNKLKYKLKIINKKNYNLLKINKKVSKL